MVKCFPINLLSALSSVAAGWNGSNWIGWAFLWITTTISCLPVCAFGVRVRATGRTWGDKRDINWNTESPICSLKSAVAVDFYSPVKWQTIFQLVNKVDHFGGGGGGWQTDVAQKTWTHGIEDGEVDGVGDVCFGLWMCVGGRNERKRKQKRQRKR